MSGVGSSELIILLLIGLIVLGPQRLPEIANKLGSWVGQARRMTRQMKRQLEDELNVDEFTEPPMIASPPLDTDPGEPPAAHIPRDDDTYSPLHGEEDDESDDEQDDKDKTA